MSHLNREIQEALNSFDDAKAKSLLEDALKNPDAETYYLAAITSEDIQQKQKYLQKTLELNPYHEKAHLALEKVGVSHQATDSRAKEEDRPEKKAKKRTFSVGGTESTYGWLSRLAGIGLIISYFLPFSGMRGRPFSFLRWLDLPREIRFFTGWTPYREPVNMIRYMAFPNGFRLYLFLTIVIALAGVLVLLASFLNSEFWERLRTGFIVAAAIWLLGSLAVAILMILSEGSFAYVLPRPFEQIAIAATAMVVTGYGYWLALVCIIFIVVNRFRVS